jgi:hypothetical protein
VVGPRQKLVEAAIGMAVDDLRDGFGKVGVGIDFGELAGLDQRGDHSPMLGPSVRRDVMMPGVWDARLRFAIHFIRFVDGCHWSLPISFMTVVTI